MNTSRAKILATLTVTIAVAASVVFSGCATAVLPSDAQRVTVIPKESAAIEVYRPKLVVKNGNLSLQALVFRQWKAATTADSHVDLVFLDAAGKELSVDTTNFTPRSIPTQVRGPKPNGYVSVPVTLPPGTAAIEVRGHDGPHEQRKQQA